MYEEAASWLSRTFAPDVRKFVMRLVLGLSMANPAYANRYLVRDPSGEAGPQGAFESGRVVSARATQPR